MSNKMGENIPRIIDKAVDFMASSQAFVEYLHKNRKTIRCLMTYRRTKPRCSLSVWPTIATCIVLSIQRKNSVAIAAG